VNGSVLRILKSALSLSVASFLGIGASTGLAQHFDAAEYDSSARDALNYKRNSSFFAGNDLYFVDGMVTTLSTAAATFDRTLFNQFRVGADFQANSNLGVRAVLTMFNAYRKEEGKEEPRKVLTELRSELKPEVALTYLTQSGLEVGVGLLLWYFRPFDRYSETDLIKTTERISSAKLQTPYLFLVKRSTSFDGGFFYKIGSERSRRINITTDQDANELRFVDQVNDPTTASLFGRFKIWGGHLLAAFESIEAGEGGSRTDDGDTVSEDYMKFSGEGLVPLSGSLALNLAVIHRTLSYSDNRNVTFASMPLTVTHLRLIAGSSDNYAFGGVVYGSGKDAQSLPEFNASYKISVVGGTLGINLRF